MSEVKTVLIGDVPEFQDMYRGEVGGRKFVTNGAVMLLDCSFSVPVKELNKKGAAQKYLDVEYSDASIEHIGLGPFVLFSNGAHVDRCYVHLIEDLWNRRGQWQGSDSIEGPLCYRIGGEIVAVVMPVRLDGEVAV